MVSQFYEYDPELSQNTFFWITSYFPFHIWLPTFTLNLLFKFGAIWFQIFWVPKFFATVRGGQTHVLLLEL